MKASKLLYGLVISISLFGIMFIFISQLTKNYGVAVPDGFNQTFQKMTDITEVKGEIYELKNESIPTKNPPKTLIGEAIDIIGKYFERGLKVIRIIPNTIDILKNIFTSGIDSSSNILGITTDPIKTIVILCLVIGIVTFVISTYLKWEI